MEIFFSSLMFLSSYKLIFCTVFLSSLISKKIYHHWSYKLIFCMVVVPKFQCICEGFKENIFNLLSALKVITRFHFETVFETFTSWLFGAMVWRPFKENNFMLEIPKSISNYKRKIKSLVNLFMLMFSRSSLSLQNCKLSHKIIESYSKLPSNLSVFLEGLFYTFFESFKYQLNILIPKRSRLSKIICID